MEGYSSWTKGELSALTSYLGGRLSGSIENWSLPGNIEETAFTLVSVMREER